jgi:hypothetical protein
MGAMGIFFRTICTVFTPASLTSTLFYTLRMLVTIIIRMCGRTIS